MRIFTKKSQREAVIFLAGMFRRQSKACDQSFGVKQLKYLANFVARSLATPFGNGCVHGTEFAPDMATALENKPESVSTVDSR